MDFLSVFLSGFGIGKLQKPFVFISMLIGFLFFGLTGLALVVLAVGSVITVETSSIGASIGIGLFGLLSLALSGVCGHFVKRCFD